MHSGPCPGSKAMAQKYCPGERQAVKEIALLETNGKEVKPMDVLKINGGCREHQWVVLLET